MVERPEQFRKQPQKIQQVPIRESQDFRDAKNAFQKAINPSEIGKAGMADLIRTNLAIIADRNPDAAAAAASEAMLSKDRFAQMLAGEVFLRVGRKISPEQSVNAINTFVDNATLIPYLKDTGYLDSVLRGFDTLDFAAWKNRKSGFIVGVREERINQVRRDLEEIEKQMNEEQNPLLSTVAGRLREKLG